MWGKKSDKPKFGIIDLRRASESPDALRYKIPEIVEERTQSDDKLAAIDKPMTPLTPMTPKITLTPDEYGSLKIVNKNLQLEAPYFSYRPASENDIFAITQPNSTNNRISTTPEVPSVSFSNLPKNYLDTPTIGEYRESKSLYEIQAAGMHKKVEQDSYLMPRYYSKSRLFEKNMHSDSSESIKDGERTPKRLEKSKRLKNIRMQLPPLVILGSGGSDRSKDGKSTRS